MKKIYIIFSLVFLFSCSEEVISSTSSTTSSDESSFSSVDYSLFNENMIGDWYVHSSNMGCLMVNEVISIFDDYTLFVKNISFNFVGQYGDYEGTCLFLSESGITRFVVSLDGENLDWGFEDDSGYSDFGFAQKEAYSNEIKYSYVGEEWPMELINNYLGTNSNIPSYEANEYKLYTGTSQLYNDAKYAMIDIFNVSSKAITKYVSALNQSGFLIVKDTSSDFYIGYDDNRIYGLRLIEFDDNNLCIFIYNYDSLKDLF